MFKEESKNEYTSISGKVDFPIDLNTLFQFNFNMGFDPLKQSIEWLAKQQRAMDSRIKEIDEELHTSPEEAAKTPEPDIVVPPIEIPPPLAEKKPGDPVTGSDINNLQGQITQIFA